MSYKVDESNTNNRVPAANPYFEAKPASNDNPLIPNPTSSAREQLKKAWEEGVSGKALDGWLNKHPGLVGAAVGVVGAAGTAFMIKQAIDWIAGEPVVVPFFEKLKNKVLGRGFITNDAYRASLKNTPTGAYTYITYPTSSASTSSKRRKLDDANYPRYNERD